MTEPAEGATVAAEPDVLEPQLGPVAPRRGLTEPVGLLVAAAVALGLAVGFDASSRLSVVAVACAQGLLIVSWVIGTDVPGRVGAIVLGAMTAAAADVVVTQWPKGQLGTLVAVIGLAVPAMFGHQLLRGRARVRVVESLSAIALMLVATTALAALIQLRHEPDGAAIVTAVVLCAGAALATGYLVDWIWAPLRFDPAVRRGLLAVIASIGVGAAVLALRLRDSAEFSGQHALLLGAAVAAVTALYSVGMSFVEQTSTLPSGRIARSLRPLATTLLCFALMSPLAYLLCLALRG